MSDDAERKTLLKRLFAGNIFSQGMIEETVMDYLDNPRRHNAMFERLLFLLVNSFLRATQKHERRWILEAVERARETAVNEETRVVLSDLIERLSSREYIYSDFTGSGRE